jgi:hypothetical protein
MRIKKARQVGQEPDEQGVDLAANTFRFYVPRLIEQENQRICNLHPIRLVATINPPRQNAFEDQQAIHSISGKGHTRQAAVSHGAASY